MIVPWFRSTSRRQLHLSRILLPSSLFLTFLSSHSYIPYFLYSFYIPGPSENEGVMIRPCIFPRSPQPRETGSSGRARVFIYLALSVVFLLLSYQLVLNHESISIWAQQGFTLIDVYNATAAAKLGLDVVTIHEDDPNEPVPPNETELVLAAMQDSNMSWVEENVSEWPVNIYRADGRPGEDVLTVPMNTGNEAMVYLTYGFARSCSVEVIY